MNKNMQNFLWLLIDKITEKGESRLPYLFIESDRQDLILHTRHRVRQIFRFIIVGIVVSAIVLFMFHATITA